MSINRVTQVVDVATLINDTGADLVSGQVSRIGVLGVVAAKAIANGAAGPMFIAGVFDLPKEGDAGSAITEGALVYKDATNASVTGDSTGNGTAIGIGMENAADGATTCKVLLNVGSNA